MNLRSDDVFGFLKTSVDVHTLGISTISGFIRECGYQVVIATEDVQEAVMDIRKVNNASLVIKWLKDNKITCLCFSYRLDPNDGKDFFCGLYYVVKNFRMLKDDGGLINTVSFAGLPDACDFLKCIYGDSILFFPGNETPIESLQKYGIPKHKFPKALLQDSPYDKMRHDFALKLIESEKYKLVLPLDHWGYKECGGKNDSYIKRLEYCRQHHSLPIIRAHVGPYNPNRDEALKEYFCWVKDLAQSRLLDVLSIGSSQLTQSNFGENWSGLHNGGGVPVNSENEYRQILENAKPMLVRTYAGTKNIPHMAMIHERALNISWHALSFWWFCEVDGRGKNTVYENLKEHIETIKYIASTGKPLEPNVPHHFAFRGGDDITYIISGFLAAKTAKKYGITHLILQNMLNTPKYTSGVQDLAKGRAMLKLVRELEDRNFKVTLQLRAGLDYFAPDLEKAKVQLAEVTALMDDIEPDNENSPEIIHVVSYSEAVRLASPPIIKESIKITLAALQEYRTLRKRGYIENMIYDKDVRERFNELYLESKEAIKFLEEHIPNLYTPEGLFRIFEDGYFPVPYLFDSEKKYPNATKWNTAMKKGGVYVVDNKGDIIYTVDRYQVIFNG